MALLSDFQYIACVVQLPETVVTMGHSAAALIGKNLKKSQVILNVLATLVQKFMQIKQLLCEI